MRRINADKSRGFNRVIKYCSAAAAAVILAAGAVALRPALESRFADDNKAATEDASEVAFIEEKTPLQDTPSEAEISDADDAALVATSDDDTVTTPESKTNSVEPTAPSIAPEQPEAAEAEPSQQLQPSHEDKPAQSPRTVQPFKEDAMPAHAEAGETTAQQDEAEPSNEESFGDKAKTVAADDAQKPVTVVPKNTEEAVEEAVSPANYSGNQPMGDNGIIIPGMTFSTDQNDKADDVSAVSSAGSNSGRGGGSGGGASGGGASVKLIAKTVIFSVDKAYTAAFAVETEGKTRSDVEDELRALEIPYEIKEIEKNYTAEYLNSNEARRAEIESLCANERCSIVEK